MADTERELATLVPQATAGDRRALQRIMEIIHPMFCVMLALVLEVDGSQRQKTLLKRSVWQ
ncbi:hypothetical protein cgR_0718 [Corynebacterium glutamicum R]|uniref:Transposase n=1 Tax=Corynebacterium glutamicum (strain R) TaxID=340322 RepID=A0AB72V8T5_CORGB|nr:hypothetical protein cgR_0718 [Corynebacterium glutamicum R]